MFAGFIVPVAAVILLKSTLYDSWRHMFFIYPFLAYFMAKGLFFLSKVINNKLNIESENFGYFISRYIYRPLSLFLTIPFAVLNISPDHLERHKNMKNYVNIKSKIFSAQLVILSSSSKHKCGSTILTNSTL